jgi:hypothetical protein
MGDQGFLWGDLSERDHVKDPGVDRKIILKWIFKKWVEGIDWFDLAQDRDRWWDVVNAVMNVWVQYYAGNSWSS